MKNERKAPLFDIKKLFPQIDQAGQEAFNIIFQIYEKYYKEPEKIDSSAITVSKKYICETDTITLFFEFIENQTTYDVFSELSDEDTNTLNKYKNIFNNSIKEQLKAFLDARYFFLAEYIKRNYYINKIKNGCTNLAELEEFQCLSNWRKKREKRITDKKIEADCDLGNCYFRKEKGAARKNLRHPFFYNSDCKPPLQGAITSCRFKSEILTAIIAFHNEKHPDFLSRLNDNRLSHCIKPNANIINWSKEFRDTIDILHQVTFENGLLIFDLFGLASPEKLLENSVKNNTQISDEIMDTIYPEFFIKKGAPDKLNDPENMAVIRKDPDKSTVDKPLLEQMFKGFEFVIGIEEDITSDNFSLKKEVLRIRKSLEAYDPSNVSEFDHLKHQSQYIVFAFNPSASSFNIKKCIEDVRLIINSYRSALMPFSVQIDEFQEELFNIYQKIQYVKSYQESDRARAVGLYIWDQVHFLNKPINVIIHELIDSEFYEKAMKLSNAEIKQRKGSASAVNKIGSLGSQKEYDEIYRNYEYTNCCIEHAEILTGAECERIISAERQNNKS